ncbi:hypothetical protein [Flavobacterium sp. N2820]|jgi:hypothetical protein|uniref:hypothetical protein n=1 Tax=Flavobacterium sp. N2820 TaxID=2986834 RepID=UPI00222544A7|nr:hypothetical protein [Flavobacterium sp. N2820]
MRFIFLFIFFWSCNTKKSIPSEPFFSETYCQGEINRAKEDYKNGKKIYIIIGLVVADEFQMFYKDYMLNKYNISVEANCNPNFKEECYASTMENEIENEFGEKFISRTLVEAKKKYRKIKKKHQTKI